MGGAPSLAGLSLITKRIVVGVGDMAVSNDQSSILSTYALGSCVGVVMFDPQRGIAGMLHVMLPDSKATPEKAIEKPHMFADTGMASLMKAVTSLGAKKENLSIYLAGGANVLKGADFFKIGERNSTTIKRYLLDQGLRTKREDLGGLNNRTLHFKISAGTVELKLPQETLTIQLT